jgi:Xaa-Pro aminopeptidase
VEQAYADVLATFKAVMKALTPGTPCRDYQALACDLLEARGHPTLRTDPRGLEGYVHSLAHGVGLNIHEAPSFRSPATNTDRLEPGMVVTIEPGVYYPERGYGVRIEDCVYSTRPRSVETLGRYHKTRAARAELVNRGLTPCPILALETS